MTAERCNCGDPGCVWCGTLQGTYEPPASAGELAALARRSNELDVIEQAKKLVNEHFAGFELMHMALGNDCAGAGKDHRHDAIDAFRDLVALVCQLEGKNRVAFENEAWAKVGRRTL